MKTVWFHILLLGGFLFAGKTGEPPSPVTAPSFKMNELQNLYIGFAEDEIGKKLIVLKISPIDSLESEILFHYTLNSKTHRRDGSGKIYVDQQLIEFHKLFAGKIYRNPEGKFIFESLHQNPLNHWKIKER